MTAGVGSTTAVIPGVHIMLHRSHPRGVGLLHEEVVQQFPAVLLPRDLPVLGLARLEETLVGRAVDVPLEDSTELPDEPGMAHQDLPHHPVVQVVVPVQLAFLSAATVRRARDPHLHEGVHDVSRLFGVCRVGKLREPAQRLSVDQKLLDQERVGARVHFFLLP